MKQENPKVLLFFYLIITKTYLLFTIVYIFIVILYIIFIILIFFNIIKLIYCFKITPIFTTIVYFNFYTPKTIELHNFKLLPLFIRFFIGLTSNILLFTFTFNISLRFLGAFKVLLIFNCLNTILFTLV